jgi:ABC-type nitrate/sulfonate/bicarbonate transport system substrate-binding protein
VRLGIGGKVIAVLAGVAIIGYALDRYVGTDRVAAFFGLRLANPGLIAPGDFPAGASAPAGDVVALPPRPIRIALVPRGAIAPLLLAVGGVRTNHESLLFKGYGLDAEITLEPDIGSVRAALASGGEHGGADLGVLSTDGLAELKPLLRDAAPRTVALLGRSRGFEGIAAAPGIERVEDLKGKSIGVVRYETSRYFALWRLAQAGLDENAVRFVEFPTTADCARALRDGRVDAAAGVAAELTPAARDRGGKLVATTADAPYLCTTLLVARGDFSARYAEAVRRVVRSVFDALDAMGRDPVPAAQLLGTAAPFLGDPRVAISADVPARLSDNLAFFGLAGDSAVRYVELYASSAGVWSKLKEPADTFPPAESVDLTVLRAIARGSEDRKTSENR